MDDSTLRRKSTTIFEEFYDDVHEEFQKFGELVNFKVCSRVRRRPGQSAPYPVFGPHPCSVERCATFCTASGIVGASMYAWADWDSQPPRFWQCIMDQLFGCKGGTRQRREDVHIENGERISHRSWASDHLHRSSRSSARSHSSDREDHHRQLELKRPRTSTIDKLGERGAHHSGSRSRLSKTSTREYSSVDTRRRSTDPSTLDSEDERAFLRDRSRIRKCGEDRPSRRERSRSRSRRRARHSRHEEDVKEDSTSSRRHTAVDSGDEDGEEQSIQVGRWRSSKRAVESNEEEAVPTRTEAGREGVNQDQFTPLTGNTRLTGVKGPLLRNHTTPTPMIDGNCF